MAKNKEGFITGTCSRPDDTDKNHYQWKRVDLLVRQWILHSMEPVLRANFKYVSSSKQLWGELVERYGQVNSLELYQLKKDLGAISQENSGVVDYYSRLKRTWEEIDAIDPLSQCTCGALNSCSCVFLKRLFDREMQSKLIQMLMGLNSGFENVKSNILTMDPMPTINKALGLLQRIETQKEISDSIGAMTEANAYASFKQSASTLESTSKKPKLDTDEKPIKHCSHCKKKGHDVTECYQLQTCPLCNVFGHVEFQCYLARGLGRGGRGRSQSAYGRGRGRSNSYHRQGNNVYRRPAANNADAVRTGSQGYEDETPFDAAEQEFYDTDDTHNQSQGAHNQSQGGQQYGTPDLAPGLVDKVVQQVIKVMSANTAQSNASFTIPATSFAGITSVSGANTSSSKTHSDVWIVDSGASDHMTSCLSLVHHIRPLRQPILVGLPDGSTKLVHKTGAVYLTKSITLYNVLIIPEFKQNLLSVSRLLQSSGLKLIFHLNECWFQDPLNRVIVAKAKRQGNLYLMRHQLQQGRSPSNSCNCFHSVKST
ncbi:uncharacterized protein LOC141649616 [Silene latifolia]|uniref:uncharacterized protein LOC141649616 n=1 Tax=Silene latifolia TaxID=37657 RepID=UPI003D7803D3